ncbi:MAG: carboxypeptidase regulatory-like domain-containing protein [Candidatus Hydrogenedentes bacterium]|nr:carboxypeptidase regulatory-like domain-containing protein [Candidatus Hydrogenedentota bacterium]
MRQTLIALVVVALVVVLAVGAGVALYMATRDSQRHGGLRAGSSPLSASPTPGTEGLSDTDLSSNDVNDEGSADEDEPEAHPVRIYGTVTVAATGAPVAGATILSPDGGYEEESPEDTGEEVSSIVTGIKAVMEAFSEDTLEVKTDDSGAYELTASSEGATLLCTAQGFASAQFDFYDPELTEKRLDFRLVPEATLSGRVVDEQGKGVGGVLIYMEDVRSWDDVPGFGWGGPYDELASEEDGSYSVVGLPPGNYQLSADAEAAGYIVDEQNCPILNVREGEHVAGVDILLTPAGTVTGTVRDSRGNPVFEASVTAVFEPEPASPISWIYSDYAYGSSEVDGTFEVRAIRFDREFHLLVEHEDFSDARTEPMTLSPASPSASLNVVLLTGSQISGKVVNTEGNTPEQGNLYLAVAKGVAVRSGGWMYWPEYQEVGSFTIAHVPPGTYQLHGGTTPMTLEVRAGEDISGLRVVVKEVAEDEEPQPELTGVVLGSDGEPRPDVDVELWHTPSGAAFDWAVTAEDGTFVFTGITSSLDEMADLLIADPAAQTAEDTFELRATSEEGVATQPIVHRGDNVTLRLRPAASVAGTVVDSQGQPVPSCEVTLLPAEGGPERSRLSAINYYFTDYYEPFVERATSVCDETGHFEFAQVDNGAYSIVAVSMLKGAGESQTFNVAQGAGPGALTIALENPVSFTGKVTDPDGRPMAGAAVELYRSFSGSDELGTLIDFDSDYVNGAAMSDASGAFEIGSVPHGIYSVRATYRDFAPFVQHGVEIAQGRGVSGFVIALTRGGAVHGAITGPDDSPANAYVYLVGEKATANANTDEQGSFEIAGIPAGAYTLSVSVMDNSLEGMEEEPLYHSIRIVDGQVTETEIRVGAGVDVAGTVSGQLPEGPVWVCLVKEDAGREGAALDEDRVAVLALSKLIRKIGADGSFELKRVEPGTYTVFVAVTETGLNLGMAEGAAALAEALADPLHAQELTLRTEAVTLDIEIP